MNEDTTQVQPPATEPPRRFLRSRSDRMIAGVAGGLGEYFDVDPVIFRIGFVVSLFLGGLGLLAYIGFALFVDSEEGEAATGAPGGRRRTALRVLAVIGVAVAITAGLVAVVAAGVFATATGHGLAAAIVVIALGAVLAVAAFRGGARWLIVPALALALGVGGAAAADLEWKGGVGDREYHPVSAAAIPANGYRLGLGRLAVDLRGIDWKRTTVVRLKTRLGVGEEVIAVPSNVCVEANAHAGAGQATVAGVQSSGFDVDNDQQDGSTATPRLVLDAGIDAGDLTVVNSDDASLSAGQHGLGADATALRAAESRACKAGAR